MHIAYLYFLNSTLKNTIQQLPRLLHTTEIQECELGIHDTYTYINLIERHVTWGFNLFLYTHTLIHLMIQP